MTPAGFEPPTFRFVATAAPIQTRLLSQKNDDTNIHAWTYCGLTEWSAPKHSVRFWWYAHMYSRTSLRDTGAVHQPSSGIGHRLVHLPFVREAENEARRKKCCWRCCWVTRELGWLWTGGRNWAPESRNEDWNRTKEIRERATGEEGIEGYK